jgi:hypothetical protein
MQAGELSQANQFQVQPNDSIFAIDLSEINGYRGNIEKLVKYDPATLFASQGQSYRSSLEGLSEADLLIPLPLEPRNALQLSSLFTGVGPYRL